MSKRTLFIAIITFITAVAWVVFGVIHTRASVKIPPQTEQLIAPLDPNFDLESIKGLP